MTVSTVSSNTAPDCCRPFGTYLDLDCDIALPVPFVLDYETLQIPISIKARLIGPENAPVILALAGISANRNVTDSHTQSGWWTESVGSGKPIDTRYYRVLSFDFFPGDSDALNCVTPNDQARIARIICDYFNITRLEAFIGYSYGGMVALAFGQLFPERVKQLIVTSAAHRPHPLGTAWRSVQRKIVQFGLESGQPTRAMSLARELGMTTYRTAQEFGTRFARSRQSNDRFEVEDYLESRGQAFCTKMSPQRYLALSESIDLHHVSPEAITVPTTLIGCRQDQLVPIEEIRLLQKQLPYAITRYEFDSIYGHDAFLKETQLIGDLIQTALAS